MTTLTEQYDRRPLIVATSALLRANTLSYGELGTRITKGEPVLLLFGTAHGLGTGNTCN